MSRSVCAEAQRLAALQGFRILDTDPEEAYDDIVNLAAQICGTPVALISFVDADRQWFKARIGLDVSETPINQSICASAIQQRDLVVIPDLTDDERTRHNTLVTEQPNFRFYAGAVLETADGDALGTLCVLDDTPRAQGLTPLQETALQTLARQVMTQLELRRVAQVEVTTRKALETSRSRYEAIFDCAVDHAIIVIDHDGSVVDWSAGAERILGWSADEIRGQHLSIFFTPEDCADGVPQREMEHARALNRGADERWHMRNDGTRFWASGDMRPLLTSSGEIEGFVKIVRDRTGPRMAEEQLKASEQRWRGLFETMREGFFLAELVRDEQGRAVDYRFLDVNPAFTEQSGLPRTAVGRTVRYFADNVEQSLIDRLAQCVETGEPQTFEVDVPAVNRWFEVRSTREAGERFSCLFYDITDRKNAEQQRQLLMEELSHRVKNTFTVVQAIAAQTLRGLDQDIVATFQNRLMALDRAHTMLLRTDWESATLFELMDSALRLQAEGGRYNIAGPDLTLNGQSVLSLSLLLHEMATNAVKYGALSVDGGRIDVKWSIDGETFRLQWHESGGPLTRPPSRRGFGSRLIGLGINGSRVVQLEYAEAGLRADFSAPLAELLER